MQAMHGNFPAIAKNKKMEERNEEEKVFKIHPCNKAKKKFAVFVTEIRVI